jgi:hypothetical protein
MRRVGLQGRFKQEEEPIICVEIMGIRTECDTREAIRRVAAKRHASERTIYGIWGKHHPKKMVWPASSLKTVLRSTTSSEDSQFL